MNYLSFQRAFFFLLLLLLCFFFVELCRPVLYDVRNQSSFIAGGGGRGRSEHFGGIIWFSGGMDGEQWSLTDFKGGYTKLTANGAGSLKYYRDLWGYSGSFYCDMTNNPPPSPPPPPPHPLPPHVKWCLKITKLSPKVITNVRNGQRITEYQFSVSKTFCIFRWVLREGVYCQNGIFQPKFLWRNFDCLCFQDANVKLIKELQLEIQTLKTRLKVGRHQTHAMIKWLQIHIQY